MTAPIKPKLKRKPKQYGGSYTAIVMPDGRSHQYENEAIPTRDGRTIAHGGEPAAPLYRAVCEVCHNASSYLMLKKPPTVECMTCKEDRAAIHALTVQAWVGYVLWFQPPEWWKYESHSMITIEELASTHDDRWDDARYMRLDVFGQQFDLGWDELGVMYDRLPKPLRRLYKGQRCVPQRAYSEAVRAMIKLGARLK
jgi:hypothetical protein